MIKIKKDKFLKAIISKNIKLIKIPITNYLFID